MQIEPVAHIENALTTKFGVPRQSGLAPAVESLIVFEKQFANPDALRGLEGFSHLWLIWGFSEAVREGEDWQPLVRPPRLGGNTKVGVFATRSPFRPNNLGLSSVELLAVEGTRLKVRGADLMCGTPIYDIKPYIPYTDSHASARGGFVDGAPEPLEVHIPAHLEEKMGPAAQAIRELLALDPRPAYHDDESRIYGMPHSQNEVKFRVSNGQIHVTDYL